MVKICSAFSDNQAFGPLNLGNPEHTFLVKGSAATYRMAACPFHHVSSLEFEDKSDTNEIMPWVG